jgi:tartrate-resistant acid phosphatase type 5
VIRGALLALALGATADGAPAPSPAAGPEVAPATVRALVFGDFGDPTPQQRAVAAALLRAARRTGADLAFSAGDNLYECGPDPSRPGAERCAFGPDGNTVVAGYEPPRDTSFALLFEDALAALPMPVHLALGNHDVAAELRCRVTLFGSSGVQRRKACLEVAHRSPRWSMPGRHYVVDRGPARFVVLDTNVIPGGYGGFDVEGEAAFLAEAARTRGDRLLFVVGHHPPASAGTHSGEHDAAYRRRVRRLEEAAGGAIAGWFAGHDHDLQHLRASAGYDVFVSGNGSRARPEERFERVAPADARLLFASTRWGFLSVEASSAHWAVRFEDDTGAPLHCCRAAVPGRCEPSLCAPAPTDAPER